MASAQCERCFSALKRLRSTMTENMEIIVLVNLASLSIEHDIARQLYIEAVVDEFASSDRNRKMTSY